ncbi:hypothetical protein Rs2_52042 [Raphanus sativus]|nr:hypothetical protein Rs2_52042 [Raphanus sativus]
MEPWSDVNVEWNDVPAFDPGTPDSPDIDSDGEDRRERNDYNIEKDAMNFVDEPPVKHNLYPETESDEEADVEENQRKEFGRLNNSTESFNNSIGKARDKPFVPMLETIARLAMVRIAKRDVICSSYEGICTPYVVEMLEKLHQKASESTIRPSTNQTYEYKTLKRIMHCGQCGAANHNIRFHKNKTFVSGESSQPEASQGVCTQGSQSRK